MTYLNKTAIEARNSLNETNDCSVIAVMHAASVSYEEAHKALAAEGRKNRKGAFNDQILNAIRSFGIELEVVDNSDYIEKLRVYYKYSPKRLTPNQFGWDAKIGADETLVAFLSGHVFAIVDSEVKDWTKGRKHEIYLMYRVKNPVPAKAEPVELPPRRAAGLTLSYDSGDLFVSSFGYCSSLSAASNEGELLHNRHEPKQLSDKQQAVVDEWMNFEADYYEQNGWKTWDEYHNA